MHIGVPRLIGRHVTAEARHTFPRVQETQVVIDRGGVDDPDALPLRLEQLGQCDFRTDRVGIGADVLSLMVGFGLVTLLFLYTGGKTRRWEGAVLLLGYLGYIWWLVQ